MEQKHNFYLLTRMKQLHWTQKNMADFLEISPSNFSAKVNGKVKFTKCEKFCIAAVLHIKPEDIE